MKTYKGGPLTAADRVRVRKWQRALGINVDGKPLHETINTGIDAYEAQKGNIKTLMEELALCRQPDDPGPYEPDEAPYRPIVGIVIAFMLGVGITAMFMAPYGG